MSTVVGRLRAELGLDSSGFQSGLQQSQASFQSFGRQMANIGKGVALAGVSAFAAFNNSANRMTDLQRQAEIAGLTAQDFNVAAQAAREYGIEQGKLSDVLKDVNDRLGEYRETGGGEMAEFFEKIAPKVGLTLEAFEGLNSSEALQLYVTALQDAKLPQQQMTYYMEALADDATGLIPVFGKSGEALDAMGERMRKLGVNIDDDLLTSTRAARGDINLISEALRTNFDQAILKMGPSLANLAAAFVPVAGGIATVLEKITEWTDVAGKSARSLIDNSETIQAAWGYLGPFFSGLFEGISNNFQTWVANIKAPFQEIINMLDAVDRAGRSVEQFMGRFTGAGPGLEGTTAPAGADVIVPPTEELRQGLAGGTAGIRVQGITDGQAYQDGFAEVNGIQSPSKVFHRFGGWITEGLANGIDSGSGNVQSSMKGIADGMLSHFDGVFSGVENLGDLFDNLKISFGRMLQDMASRLFQSGLQDLLGSVFGGFLAPATGGLSIPGFATGTNYAPGGLAQINERGGEIMNLPRGTQVIPHDLSKQMIQNQGGTSRIELTLSPDLEGRILSQAEGQSVQITQQGIGQLRKQMPNMVNDINRNHRKRYA